MIDTPKSLLLQVLPIPPSGSPRDQCIGLSEKPKTNSRERLCQDFARIKSLPKRLLSAAMIVDVSFELITIFTAMCLNVDRLFFFEGEQNDFSEDLRRSSQKRFISSRPTVSAYSKSFCTVWDTSTQEDIWIRDSRWSNGFAHPFRTSRSRSTQDLSKFIRDLPISFVREWGFASTPSSNCNLQWAIIWLGSAQRCTVPGVVLYPVIPPWDSWCLFIVCSTVWSDATRLGRPYCLLTVKFPFLKKNINQQFWMVHRFWVHYRLSNKVISILMIIINLPFTDKSELFLD